MDERLSVSRSFSQKVSIILSPAGSYFGNTFEPVNLILNRDYERGNPRSAARFKLGGNYAPTIKPANENLAKGYDQVLWVHDEKIIEVGAMNIFFLIKNEEGSQELVTPPLDGSVLPGVTRKSIIELVKEQGTVPVFERDITVTELITLFEEDRVVEIFGAGTAATSVPVKKICIDDKIYRTKVDGESGWDFTKSILNQLTDIYYGRVEHKFSHKVSS